MLKKYIKNRLLRTAVYIGITLAGLYLILHLILAYRAKEIIRNIVSQETDGKVDVKIGKVRFSLFPETRLDLSNTQLIFWTLQASKPFTMLSSNTWVYRYIPSRISFYTKNCALIS